MKKRGRHRKPNRAKKPRTDVVTLGDNLENGKEGDVQEGDSGKGTDEGAQEEAPTSPVDLEVVTSTWQASQLSQDSDTASESDDDDDDAYLKHQDAKSPASQTQE